MIRADKVYTYLKGATHKDAAVKTHLDEMRKRFVRKTETPADTQPPDNGV